MPGMEMISVKPEENLSKCRMSVVEGNVQEGRRYPIEASCRRQMQNGKEPLKALQVDNSAIPTPSAVKRSSRFRGVSRHRRTGRYEAHLWDKGSWNVTQRKKGKQGTQEEAARAYDIAGANRANGP